MCVELYLAVLRDAAISAAAPASRGDESKYGVDWKCRTRKWRTKKNERTENAGLKMKDQMSEVENAGPENAGPKHQDWKMKDQQPEADYEI